MVSGGGGVSVGVRVIVGVKVGTLVSVAVDVDDGTLTVGTDAPGVVQDTSAQTRRKSRLFFIQFPFCMNRFRLCSFSIAW